MDSGTRQIRISAMIEDGWDYYYIYLGQLRNIPLFYDDVHYHDHTYTSTKYRFETTETKTEEISNTVSKTSGEAVSITKEHTVSKTTGGSISHEISSEFSIPELAKIGGKDTVEINFSKLVSDTSSTEIQRSTSLENTVGYAITNSNAFRRSREFELNRADREGFYRYTRFSVSDVYLYVIMNSDRDTKELYYEFREYIIPGEFFWALDYSPTRSFNINNDTKFKIDIEVLKKLEKPSINFGIYHVKNTAEWTEAFSNIQERGNGTAVKPKTYTIVIHGDITVPPSDFGSVQQIAVTLIGDGGNRKLILGANGNMIRLGNNQKLIIDDANLTLQGLNNNTASLLYVVDDGKLELKNGNITGNINNSSGGGVSVIGGNSTFMMTGGTISGNTASGGGGVYLSSGNFTMDGGTISENTASFLGGGVYVDNSSSFTMYGGTINGNTASSGGGVYISGSTFSKSGSSIIYGKPAAASLENTARGGVGHAVFWEDTVEARYYCNSTLGGSNNISTSDYPLPDSSKPTIGNWTAPIAIKPILTKVGPTLLVTGLTLNKKYGDTRYINNSFDISELQSRGYTAFRITLTCQIKRNTVIDSTSGSLLGQIFSSDGIEIGHLSRKSGYNKPETFSIDIWRSIDSRLNSLTVKLTVPNGGNSGTDYYVNDVKITIEAIQ